jgi:plasmid maintenance system antidote protein VapI
MLKKLRDYINKEGIKKNKIAEKLGCSKEHLSYVINGKRPLSSSLEAKIKELIEE